MKVINLFAAPGTGKTTTGQILSGLLSIADYRVEYIPEFAKFATFSNHQAALSDQIYMFAKQENRLHVLRQAELDYVVMDGPLPIALLFQPPDYYRHYEPLVMEVFGSHENVNFLLHRDRSQQYKQHGRWQNEEESARLHQRLVDILGRHDVPYSEHRVSRELPAELFERVTGRPAPRLA